MTSDKALTAMTKPELLKEAQEMEAIIIIDNEEITDYRTVVQRLLDVAADVTPMDKEQVGSMTYKAFAIDTVYSTLRPLFVKHGVIAIPRTKHVEYVMTPRHEQSPAVDARVEIEYTFHAPDGSHVEMRFSAEGRDFGDKATNKAVQQAYKYGLIQMFMISTGEIDPDNDTNDETLIPAKHAQTVTQTSKQPVQTAEADVKSLLLRQVKDHAWLLTKDVEPDAYRIEETQLLVESEIEAYGREPQDATDAQAIMANMDVTMTPLEAESSS